jgi:hypothetical protein
MSTPTGNLVKWWPGEEMSPKERFVFNAINDHDQAITLLAEKVAGLPTSTSTATPAPSASVPITGVVPGNTPAVTSEWINSYNSANGQFTQTQPAFTDVSGNITASQGPTAAFSGTITTAKLTTGGTNGSQTFVNGILTAQTPAT